MIRVESLLVEEFRGIHHLSIIPGKQNFAILGPNGTGKSGIVDALEFVITGFVTRLTGQGTAGISVRTHGPHVDSRDKPGHACVTLKAFIPSLNKTVTIQRSVETAGQVTISPDDADVREVLGDLSKHPEFALSRREIIKYVVATPGDRAREVQALLKLEAVAKVRQNLQTISNSCKARLSAEDSTQQGIQEQLLRALGISVLSKNLLLAAVNKRRQALGLDALTEMTPDTSLKSGLTGVPAPSVRQKVSKTQGLKDLMALLQVLNEPEPKAVSESREEISEFLQKIVDTPTLLRSVKREAFLRSGLELIDSDECPFCENSWDLAQLRTRVETRIREAEEVATLRAALAKVAGPLTAALNSLESLAAIVAGYSKNLLPSLETGKITEWMARLKARREKTPTLENPQASIAELTGEYRQVTPEVLAAMAMLHTAINQLPDQSVEEEAREYLTIGQERLQAYREAKRRQDRAKRESEVAEKVLNVYNAASTEMLEQIYKAVQTDFSAFYRLVNGDDEATFTGKLTPSFGKLGFDVDFYGRGFFPPGAYHSEGHQDTMGLCLYLALMKHTLGQNFTFAVLDDVLMSIDASHRREVCRLIKAKFPDTQFIMTTHDKIWLQHMVSEQVIARKAFVQFRKWTIDDGPIVWDGSEVWDEIARDLDQNDILGAAGSLRRYLEHVSDLLAQRLRASPEFRGDAQYELGDLLPAVVEAWSDILGKARKSAQSWSNAEALATLTQLQSDFTAKLQRSQVEQWAINKSIHYNAWADLNKQDFGPVANAFRDLLGCFRCESCGGFLYVLPLKGSRENLRCDCGKININLKVK